MEHDLDYAAIGKRIRSAREHQGLTQATLGEHTNLSTSHIGHIERGTRIPSLESLCAIAKTLDVSVDYLLLDSSETGDTTLTTISSVIKGKDPDKVRTFLVAVKALADKIDEL